MLVKYFVYSFKGVLKMERNENYFADVVVRSDEENTDKTEQTLRNLTDLIRVYNAADSLFLFCQQLTGFALSSGSIVSELLRVTDVINRMSPLHDPDVDWDDSPVATVLNNRELDVEERARRLLAV